MAATTLMLSAQQADASKEKALLVEPSTAWLMNYADDSCHLSRTFGKGDDALTIEFRQFSPSKDFELLIAGKPLQPKLPRMLVTEFGPNGVAQKHESAFQGKLADGRAVIETNGRFLPDANNGYIAGSPDRRGWKPDEEDQAPFVADAAAEAKITELRLAGPISRELVLHLGPMDKPMEAMRTCLDELLTHWGIDAAAHHSLTRRAAPAEYPGDWLAPSDYPADMLKQGRSGLVHFRLMVDANGKPTDCVVQTGGSDFDKLTCSLLMKRARFSPALDAKGMPIPSYWTDSVRWQV